MQLLTSGQFFGDTTHIRHVDGIILTHTAYTHAYVDWHYHENMYFTFLLNGRVIEGNKKKTYHCTAGTLLFHNWQEAHYNILPPGYTSGFHVELTPAFLQQYLPDQILPGGSINIEHAGQKLIFYKLFLESRLNDAYASIAIAGLIGEFLALFNKSASGHKTIPPWVSQIKELLYFEKTPVTTLSSLATQLQIHPVHLSRDFNKYFQCNLGEYIRSIKLEKAMHLLMDTNTNLSEIAAAAGFSDQSHFIRLFKSQFGILPSIVRKQLTHFNNER